MSFRLLVKDKKKYGSVKSRRSYLHPPPKKKNHPKQTNLKGSKKTRVNHIFALGKFFMLIWGVLFCSV